MAFLGGEAVSYERGTPVSRCPPGRQSPLNHMYQERTGVALKRTVAELRTVDHTNLYHIYHRNGPVSRTFELRVEQFEAVD